MTIQYNPGFLDKLKSVNVRVRKSFHEKINLFRKDPSNARLRNHALEGVYIGFKSIDITNDYRAIYEEVAIGEETIAYFTLLGTHKELYG